jgi:hypothetical protein
VYIDPVKDVKGLFINFEKEQLSWNIARNVFTKIKENKSNFS